MGLRRDEMVRAGEGERQGKGMRSKGMEKRHQRFEGRQGVGKGHRGRSDLGSRTRESREERGGREKSRVQSSEGVEERAYR